MVRSWTRVVQGVTFLAVVAVALWLVVASFQGRFTEKVRVTMRVERAGTQLEKNADVKLRGIVVGRVTAQDTGGDGAVLRLDLEPGKVPLIPRNVEARILPKTLFGEKYVDLVIPESGAAREPIRAGDVIPQDRSRAALEVERVLAELHDLLVSLEPERLARALTAIADGLRGQGERIGVSLERLDRYLARIQPELPTIQQDISGLADLAESLGTAAPDLLRLARNAVTSGRTISEKQDVLVAFLRGTSGFTGTLTDILDRDGRNLVELASTSRDVLEVVYGRREVLAPSITGLRTLSAELVDALDDGNALNIRLEVVPNRGAYDEPCEYPHCNDGDSGGGAHAVGSVGGEEEQRVLRGVVAPLLRVPLEDVPDVANLLFGPVLRGARVGGQVSGR